MGDLRLFNSSSCSSSGALIPSLSAVSQVYGRRLFSRDWQHSGTTRIASEPCRSLFSSSHSQRMFQWRALLNDQRLPYSYHSGEDGRPFKEDEELSIFDRLALAWQVLFPKRRKLVTPAEIAKQRLKMILISDRCSVNDKAKRKIVNNIVGALANFVEIESQNSICLNVSADPDLGMVYSVSVPVRRVKPEFQDNGDGVKDDVDQNGVMDSLLGLEFPVGQVEHIQASLANSQNEEASSGSAGVKDMEG